MTCCVPRGELSAVPVQWVGAVVAPGSSGDDPRAVRQALEYLRPQVPLLIVATDRQSAALGKHGVPVVVSECPGNAGMLLAALEWAAAHSRETPWVATVLAERAALPPDLVARLATAVARCGADMACVAGGGRIAWEFGLWPVRLRRNLRRRAAGAGVTHVADWARNFAVAVVDMPTPITPPHPSWAPSGEI